MTAGGGNAGAQVKVGAKVKVGIVVQSALWRQLPAARQTVRRAIAAAASHNDMALHGQVALVLTDDATIRGLNRQWRGQDKPTNVLSFPDAAAKGRPPDGRAREADDSFGDIAIAFETVAREAEAEGKPVLDHLAHLAVHGFLHLTGFDHESDGEAEAMEQRERDILARLGVPDPYAHAG